MRRLTTALVERLTVDTVGALLVAVGWEYSPYWEGRVQLTYRGATHSKSTIRTSPLGSSVLLKVRLSNDPVGGVIMHMWAIPMIPIHDYSGRAGGVSAYYANADQLLQSIHTQIDTAIEAREQGSDS